MNKCELEWCLVLHDSKSKERHVFTIREWTQLYLRSFVQKVYYLNVGSQNEVFSIRSSY